ncbi:UDP-N-acetylglucosamine 2-epimerase (non-hydrolyzing) [Methanococcus maripaludis]|uniref:UDP-N-acetylglucosamine 2-epimerase (Non-hydrolyzing) n=1 Tax=Methanococcus maripaludis TaxID=39152 RepID=A0A7J9P1I2_METMI|nr:UDP-N-acetylglucosamine 2-epimerase (non-hydrolyzing) [Methanococcus maripaludis]MBA2853788.1 UDP-N-acetylglucosamine 2-epimerase (non-hydrolyzing) [Methanococcus maripaludis]
MYKIGIILGTRPEIIKMSPVIRELTTKNFFLIHTNQHYSENMDKIFFEELNLKKPDYNLNIGSGSHGDQTGRMLIEIEKVLLKEKPDLVLVQGDTNTVLAGALAASKLGVKIGHIEAGLRSFDRKMPEETNRVLTDHISEFLFAPTETAAKNILNEGISGEKIHIVGNTIVDATIQNLKIAEKNEKVCKFISELTKNEKYFLLTLHRAENTDSFEILSKLVDSINKLSKKYEKNIIFPIHPRTHKKLTEFGLINALENNPLIKIIEPVGYLEFLGLEKNAELIITDSGGLQEEACILNVPCVTLRENTERPETLDVNSNILAGSDPENILNCVEKMLKSDKHWNNPFGDGNSGKIIVDIVFSEKKF